MPETLKATASSVRLSATEWELMLHCWQLGPCTLAELFAHLDQDRWTYPTVNTFLQRMTMKGYLVTSKTGRKNQLMYTPKSSYEEAVRLETIRFFDRVIAWRPEGFAILRDELARHTAAELP